MDAVLSKTSVDLQFTQIGWVVKDLKVAVKFFTEAMGAKNFGKAQIIRAQEFDATWYGEPCIAETLVSMAYTGETFIELIQPLSGRSMFHDYLEKNPAGGVQHIAYSTPVANLDKVIAGLKDKGYPVIATYDTPIAKIIFVDSYKDVGVVTEIMGITKEGEKAVQKMKSGTA